VLFKSHLKISKLNLEMNKLYALLLVLSLSLN
jgi:hypothetical protein